MKPSNTGEIKVGLNRNHSSCFNKKAFVTKYCIDIYPVNFIVFKLTIKQFTDNTHASNKVCALL